MSQTNLVDRIKTRVLCSITFFSESCGVCNIMWKKYFKAGQATDNK